MNEILKNKMIEVCNLKIEKKGANVGLSFYAFFSNKNDNPTLLMEVAHWWIMTHKLDHFEKAVKIKKLVENMVDVQKFWSERYAKDGYLYGTDPNLFLTEHVDLL